MKYLILLLIVSVLGNKRHDSFGDTAARHAMQHWLEVERSIDQRHPLINLKMEELKKLNKRMALHAKKTDKTVAEGIRAMFNLGRLGNP
jgi:indole-3-glycerol phosphate synthase